LLKKGTMNEMNKRFVIYDQYADWKYQNKQKPTKQQLFRKKRFASLLAL